jgi:FkbM family methyltransferase
MKLDQLVSILLPDQSLTVVDAGAAGGLHPRWKPVCGHLRSVGFEPLERHRDDGRNLTLPYALGSSIRPGKLLITRRVSMTSLLQPSQDLISRFWDKPGHTEIVEEIPVELRRLDDLAGDHDIRPDMLKIDVQGGEYDILRGATGCLQGSVIAAEIELSFIERYKGLTPFCGVVAFMEEQGFELIDLWRLKRYRHRNTANVSDPGTSRGLRAGRLAFCDTLFLRRDAALLEYAAASRLQAAKAMIICLIYGKADMAARLHDAARDRFDGGDNASIDRYFRRLSGKHVGRLGMHRALDYFASKV